MAEQIAPSQLSSTNGSIVLIIDGGSSAIETGIKGDIRIPFNCTISKWTLMTDQSGSIEIDIWKDESTNFPPTVDDTIIGATSPAITIESGTIAEDDTLDGWETTIDAGDILRINVDSCTTITRCTLQLDIIRI